MSDANGTENVILNLQDSIQQEIDDTQRELKEIALMLDQSQVEVEKLGQRNATITMHLQQVENKFDEMPREEIRNAYDAALDAQQRLVVMRGQLEKLQSDQTHLDRYLVMLRKIKKSLDGGSGETSAGGATNNNFATAEMLIQAQETERKRLSRQMHDGPAQELSNFILQTEIAMRLFEIDQEKARAELTSLKGAAATTFQQVRDFIFDLRPMMLDDLGLAPTVKRYCNSFREKNKVDLVVSVSGSERRIEPYMEVMVFRALQELLNNAMHHAQATQIKVQLDMGMEFIRLTVEDNGKGFSEEQAQAGQGLGIKVIRDRAEMLNGEFEVDSALGQGARITLMLPVSEVKEAKA